MKKVLSLLLVAAMLVCMMPAMAFATEECCGLAAEKKFGVELTAGEDSAYLANFYVDNNYDVTAYLNNVINFNNVAGKVMMHNVASLDVTECRSYEVGPMDIELVEGFDGDIHVTENALAKELGLDKVYAARNFVIKGKVNNQSFGYTVTGTPAADGVNFVADATDATRDAWQLLASNVTTDTTADDTQLVLADGASIQIGTEKLNFTEYALNPNGQFDPFALIEDVQNAATLDKEAATVGEDVLKVVIPAESIIQLGGSVATVEKDMTVTVDFNTSLLMTGGLGVLSYLQDVAATITDPEEGIDELPVLTNLMNYAFGIIDELNGGHTIDVTIEFAEEGQGGEEGGSDIFFPVYVAPVDPLAEERAEANAAVDLVEAADATEYTEVADEIKAIADKAAADIAAAKTAEEIAAIEAEAKAAIEEIKLVFDVEETGLVARSEFTKSPKGKDAILITWYDKEDRDVEFEGVEIFRSTKRNSGFKKIFTSKTDKYYNTAIEEGVKYFYRVRGYVTVDGEKVYTDLSLRAIRTAK